MSFTFKALVVDEIEPNRFIRNIREKSIDELPKGEVLIKVHYSALNYKDALSARGHKGITRKYPHTPGVDAAGIVESSDSDIFKVGEQVIVTGYDLGMNTSGGFAEYIRVPFEWVVKLPPNLTLRESMIYGTAGFTAGLSIDELQTNGIKPGNGKILVTGATGGVGTLAIAMLAKAGYYVVASTGKPEQSEFLKEVGAKEVINREEVNDKTGKPLLPARWAGAIDTVGGNTLSTIIRSLDRRGVVCCLGLVESDKLDVTVYPFILRGVILAGIDSAERPMDIRLNIWYKIANQWRIDNPDRLVKEISLDGINDEIELILQGKQVGKVIVRINN
jgi:acrylyl-CoA reductase (NADPH)